MKMGNNICISGRIEDIHGDHTGYFYADLPCLPRVSVSGQEAKAEGTGLPNVEYAIEILERERWAMRGYLDGLYQLSDEECFAHPEIPKYEARLAEIEEGLRRLRTEAQP